MIPNPTEQQALIYALTQIAAQVGSAEKELQQFLDAIDASSESERWKVAGDMLLEKARDTLLNNKDASYCLLLGCAALGRSVVLARQGK